MFLKIMTSEDIPDDDPRKCFALIAGVQSVLFYRPTDEAKKEVERQTGDNNCLAIAHINQGLDGARRMAVYGNAYLLNEMGDLITSFGVAEHVDDDSQEGEPGGTTEGRSQLSGL